MGRSITAATEKEAREPLCSALTTLAQSVSIGAVRALKWKAALITIFVIALGLRSYHLSSYPKPNQTADEYAWTWAGLTLVTTGVPRSWSWLGPYPAPEVKHWRGHEYRMVRPWLDHPPLFPLAMGAWMRSLGYKDPFWVDLWTMRVASLLLFVVTFWLLAAVLTRLTDRRTLLLTLIIYAVSPLAVFNARLVVAEHLFVPIHLALLWAVLRYQRPRWLPAIGVGALALPLTKIAATALSLHLVIVAWARDRRAAAIVIGISTVLGGVVYWLYGRHYGGELFVAVIRAHGIRFGGFDAFWELLFNHKVIEERTPYLLFPLGLCVLVGDARSTIEWVLLVVVYAGMIAFFADGSMVRSWYLVPLYPALCYGVARQICAMWDEAGARHKWIWIAFVAPGVAAELVRDHAERMTLVRYGYLAALMAAAALFLTLRTAPRWVAQATTITLVAASVLSDVATVLSR